MDILGMKDGMYILQPPRPAWTCELHPGTFWHVEEGKQPNRFHRWMQKICFGFKWTEIEYDQFE